MYKSVLQENPSHFSKQGILQPSVLYALLPRLPREYSPKYSVNISVEGFSMDRSPPTDNPMRAWIVPSVISGATCSGSSCGGASAIRRNPSRPFLLNHLCVAVESAMRHVSSSSMSACFSKRVLFSVRLSTCVLFVVRLSTCVLFCALHNLSSRNENPSLGVLFREPIFFNRQFLIPAHARCVP